MKRFIDFQHESEDDRLKHLEHPSWDRFDHFMMAMILIILSLGLWGLIWPML